MEGVECIGGSCFIFLICIVVSFVVSRYMVVEKIRLSSNVIVILSFWYFCL
jgi:hypothetical protein